MSVYKSLCKQKPFNSTYRDFIFLYEKNLQFIKGIKEKLLD